LYLAAHKKTNCIFAIKSTKKKAIKPVVAKFIAELKLGLLLDSPNVAKVYGFFADGDNFYVIKEYMEEGSICERRRKLA
jgi:serine/threonine protein kinase